MNGETIDTFLGELRQWMLRDGQETLPPLPESVMDLSTLLGQLVAVKQEVHLQTKSVRAQQQQNAEALERLSESLDMLRQEKEKAEERQAARVEGAIKPLLKTLIASHDALSRAAGEAERVTEEILPALRDSEQPPKPRGFFSRLFGSRQSEQPDQGLARVDKLLGSLVTGYRMSLDRIERALQQQELVPIPVEGERFDPDLMEVVDVVTDSGRPSGEVVEELRRGYLHRGRVLRTAQVRVAKSE